MSSKKVIKSVVDWIIRVERWVKRKCSCSALRFMNEKIKISRKKRKNNKNRLAFFSFFFNVSEKFSLLFYGSMTIFHLFPLACSWDLWDVHFQMDFDGVKYWDWTTNSICLSLHIFHDNNFLRFFSFKKSTLVFKREELVYDWKWNLMKMVFRNAFWLWDWTLFEVPHIFS